MLKIDLAKGSQNMRQTFLILGGYGNTGRIVAELLLQQTDLQLILAGRNLTKAENLATNFNNQFPNHRVSGLKVDASDRQSLEQAFAQVNFVIVASSTALYTENIAKAALKAKIDYLDFQLSQDKIEILQSLQSEIEEAGCCFITEGGFHPGLPAALVRFAATHFDRIQTANIGSVIKINWRDLTVGDDTFNELVAGISEFEPVYFQKSKWINSYWETRTFNFGQGFGEQVCYPMLLEEMRSLPEKFPDLQETGFFVGGFNWFVDSIVFPLGFVALKSFGTKAVKPIGILLNWGLKTFSKPPAQFCFYQPVA